MLEMKKVIALSLPYISFFFLLSLELKISSSALKKLCDVFPEGDSKNSLQDFQ